MATWLKAEGAMGVWTTADVAAIAAELKRRWIAGKTPRLVVAVDGLSRSGKTTWAERLEARLRDQRVEVVTLHLDDYIVERNRRYHTGHPEWFEYYALQWDVPELTRRLFRRARWAKVLRLARYVPDEDRCVPVQITLPDQGILIIEGVFLQRPEWRDVFDVVVYLMCPRDVRFQRERAEIRKQYERFAARYWPAEDYYLREVRPEATADFVVLSQF